MLIVFTHELADRVTELCTAFRGRGAANGPDDGEDKEGLEHDFQVLNLSLGNRDSISVLIAREEAIHDTHARLNDIVVHTGHGLRAILPHKAN